MTFQIQKVDCITPQSDLIHPWNPDLSNNFVYYHKKVNNGDNQLWDNLPPKYPHYQSIEEMYEDIITNPQDFIDKGPITVRCKASLLYTCDSKVDGGNSDLMTYDRLFNYTDIITKGTKFMSQHNGYSAKSDMLHGTVRWKYDKFGKVDGFTIVKDRGNLRTHIGIASNAGKDVELLITLDFHNINPEVTIPELISIESETFFEDAVDRRGFDAPTKFRAGVLSARKMFVAQAEFLDTKLKVDYADAINYQRKNDGKKPHVYSLSSLSSLDFGIDGKPGGYIHKYGEENLISAVELLKNIITETNGANQISTSVIHTFTKTFYFLTSTPQELGIKKSTDGAVCDSKILSEALEYIFTKITSRKGILEYDIKTLGKTSSEKDTTHLAFKSYMNILLKDLREDKARINHFRSKHACINAYIQHISEQSNRLEARKQIDS